METVEEIRDEMEAYPNKLNRYIHQKARAKLNIMGELNKLRGIKSSSDEIKEKVHKVHKKKKSYFHK